MFCKTEVALVWILMSTNIVCRKLEQGIHLLLDHRLVSHDCKKHWKQSSFWSLKSCRIYCRCTSNMMLSYSKHGFSWFNNQQLCKGPYYYPRCCPFHFIIFWTTVVWDFCYYPLYIFHEVKVLGLIQLGITCGVLQCIVFFKVKLPFCQNYLFGEL